MWVAVTGPVRFMCISKMDGAGAGVRAGGGAGRGWGASAYRPLRRRAVMAATPTPSDDKNAIIMAPE